MFIYIIYIRNVNSDKISGQAEPANYFVRPGPARPGIDILQIVQWIKYFLEKKEQ